MLDDLYCSDATEISSDDEVDEINFGVGLDDVEGLIDKWIPPMYHLAKSNYEIMLLMCLIILYIYRFKNILIGSLDYFQSIEKDEKLTCDQLEQFCLACWEKGISSHPFFYGGLCHSCKVYHYHLENNLNILFIYILLIFS